MGVSVRELSNVGKWLKSITGANRKFLILGIIALMCMSVIIATAGIGDVDSWSGSGTVEDPFIIATEADLQSLATNVNAGSTYTGMYFVQSNQLMLTGEHMPIGYVLSGDEVNGKYFNGSYDGRGWSIYNLASNTSLIAGKSAGLFGALGPGAVVENINIESVSAGIVSSCYVGAVAGYNNGGTIRNITVIGSGALRADSYVGGIAGYNAAGSVIDNVYFNLSPVEYTDYGTMSTIISTTSIASADIADDRFTGGIAGYNGGALTNCVVGSQTAVIASALPGGIAGRFDAAAAESVIENCAAYGPIYTTAYEYSRVGSDDIYTTPEAGLVAGSVENYGADPAVLAGKVVNCAAIANGITSYYYTSPDMMIGSKTINTLDADSILDINTEAKKYNSYLEAQNTASVYMYLPNSVISTHATGNIDTMLTGYARVYPGAGSSSQFSFTSDAPSIVSASAQTDEGGLVKHHSPSLEFNSPGTANITCSMTPHKHVASATPNPIEYEFPAITEWTYVTNVEWAETVPSTMQRGSNRQLAVTVQPDYASSKDITWSVSDGNVLSVDATGKLTALALGTATVTATADNSTGEPVKAEAYVTVKATAQTVTGTPSHVVIPAGSAHAYAFTITPADATDTMVNFTYSVNGGSSQTMSSANAVNGKAELIGRRLTGLTSGTAVVTGTVNRESVGGVVYPPISGTIQVTVRDGSTTPQVPAGQTIDSDGKGVLEIAPASPESYYLKELMLSGASLTTGIDGSAATILQPASSDITTVSAISVDVAEAAANAWWALLPTDSQKAKVLPYGLEAVKSYNAPAQTGAEHKDEYTPMYMRYRVKTADLPETLRQQLASAGTLVNKINIIRNNVSLMAYINEGGTVHAVDFKDVVEAQGFNASNYITVTADNSVPSDPGYYMAVRALYFNQPGGITDTDPPVNKWVFALPGVSGEAANSYFVIQDGSADNKFEMLAAPVIKIPNTSIMHVQVDTLEGAITPASVDYYVRQANGVETHYTGNNDITDIFADSYSASLIFEIHDNLPGYSVAAPVNTDLIEFTNTTATHTGYKAYQTTVYPGGNIGVMLKFVPKPVSSIEFTPVALDIIGSAAGSFDIPNDDSEFKVLPDDAYNKSVDWTVEDSTVASVNADGVVTAVSTKGRSNATTTVKATAKDGSGVYGEQTVTVTQKPESMSISVPAAEHVYVNDYFNCETVLSPDYSAVPITTWTVKSPSGGATDVASISGSYLTISNPGSFRLIANAAGGLSADKLITSHVHGVVISGDVPASMQQGTSVQLGATVWPVKPITWSSGNTAVATVDSTGKVTAVANGNAVITAAAEGETSATANITVKTTALTLTASPAAVVLPQENMWYNYTFSVTPKTTTDTTMTIRYRVGGGAEQVYGQQTIDGNGRVVLSNFQVPGLTSGTAVLTATLERSTVAGAAYPPLTATCNITVRTKANTPGVKAGDAITTDGTGVLGIAPASTESSYIKDLMLNGASLTTGIDSTKVVPLQPSSSDITTIPAISADVAEAAINDWWGLLPTDPTRAKVLPYDLVSVNSYNAPAQTGAEHKDEYTPMYMKYRVKTSDLPETLRQQLAGARDAAARIEIIRSKVHMIAYINEGGAVHAVSLNDVLQAQSFNASNYITVTADNSVPSDPSYYIAVRALYFNQPGGITDTDPPVNKWVFALPSGGEVANSYFVIQDGSADTKFEMLMSPAMSIPNIATIHVQVDTRSGDIAPASADYYVRQGDGTEDHYTGIHDIDNVYAGTDQSTIVFEIKDNLTGYNIAIPANTGVMPFTETTASHTGYKAYQTTIEPGNIITVTIQYMPKPVASIAFAPVALDINGTVKGRFDIPNDDSTFKVLPDDAYNKSVDWTVEDSTIAIVNADGVVTAVSTKGQPNATTKVRATAKDGSGVYGEQTVTVTQKPESMSISVPAAEHVYVADYFNCETVLSPDYSTVPAITWAVKSPSGGATSVASISGTSLSISNTGSFRLIATAAGGLSADKLITSHAHGVVISGDVPASMQQGTSVQLGATVWPVKPITWSSGNSAVATVDSTGKVTAVANGSAEITAAAEGETSATANITVKTTALTLTASPSAVVVPQESMGYNYTFSVTPKTTTDTTMTIRYRVGGGSEQTLGQYVIDSNGNAVISNFQVPGFTSGTAVLTATLERSTVAGTAYPPLTATCNITVRTKANTPGVKAGDAVTADGTGVLDIAGSGLEALYLHELLSSPTANLGAGIDGSAVTILQPASGDLTLSGPISRDAAEKAANVWWQLALTDSKYASVLPLSLQNLQTISAPASAEAASKDETVPMLLRFKVALSDLPLDVQATIKASSDKASAFMDNVPLFVYIRLSDGSIKAVNLYELAMSSLVSPSRYISATYDISDPSAPMFYIQTRVLIFNQPGGVTQVDGPTNTWVSILATGTDVSSPNNYFVIQDGIADNKFEVTAASVVKAPNKATLNFTVNTADTPEIQPASVDYYLIDANGEEMHLSGDKTAAVYAGDTSAVLALEMPDFIPSYYATVPVTDSAAVTFVKSETPVHAGYARYEAVITPGSNVNVTLKYGLRMPTSIVFSPVTLYINGTSPESFNIPLSDDAFAVTPNGPGYDTRVIWSTEDSAVATIDANGVVTAVGTKGLSSASTLIKGESSNREISYSTYATVVQRPSSIEIAEPAGDKVYISEKPVTCTTKVVPSYAETSLVTWSVTGTDGKATTIAEVTTNGDGTGALIAKGEGSFILHAESVNGFKADKTLTTKPYATGVSVSPSVKTMKIGSVQQLTATILPTTVDDHYVTWATDNSSVATVTASGDVTAHGVGYANITATTREVGSDGKTLSAVCKITVVSDGMSDDDIAVIDELKRLEQSGSLPSGIDLTDIDILTPLHDLPAKIKDALSNMASSNILSDISMGDSKKKAYSRIISQDNGAQVSMFNVAADPLHPNKYWSGIIEVTIDKTKEVESMTTRQPYLLIIKGDKTDATYNLNKINSSFISIRTGTRLAEDGSTVNTETYTMPFIIFNQPGTVSADISPVGAPHVMSLPNAGGASSASLNMLGSAIAAGASSESPSMGYLVQDGITDSAYKVGLVVAGVLPVPDDPQPDPDPDPKPDPGPDDGGGGGGCNTGAGFLALLSLIPLMIRRKQK